MFVLGLIDLALIGNLAPMVAFVGYENFVSKLQTGDSEDRPAWMEHVDFSGLKLKLLSSIVAISAIHLLRTFLDISQTPKEDVAWQLAVHLGFVISGVLLAVMNRLSISRRLSSTILRRAAGPNDVAGPRAERAQCRRRVGEPHNVDCFICNPAGCWART